MFSLFLFSFNAQCMWAAFCLQRASELIRTTRPLSGKRLIVISVDVSSILPPTDSKRNSCSRSFEGGSFWAALHDPPGYLRNFTTVCSREILTYTIALAHLSRSWLSFPPPPKKKGDNATKVNWNWYWSAYVTQNTVHYSDFDRIKTISRTRQRKIFRLYYNFFQHWPCIKQPGEKYTRSVHSSLPL